MMFTQVVLFASALMGSAYAAVPVYGAGGLSGPSSARAVFPYYGGGAGRRQGQSEAPKPYNFYYSVDDGQGNDHYRQEQSYQNGRVRGTYGYSDAHGLYRVVQYTADENGFRANITTNEPGVDGKESPADIVMNVKQRKIKQETGTIKGAFGVVSGGSVYRSYPGEPGMADKPY